MCGKERMGSGDPGILGPRAVVTANERKLASHSIGGSSRLVGPLFEAVDNILCPILPTAASRDFFPH